MSPVCWPATVSVEGGGVRVRAQALIDDEVSGRIGPEPPMRTQEPALLPRLEGPTRLEFVCAPRDECGTQARGQCRKRLRPVGTSESEPLTSAVLGASGSRAPGHSPDRGGERIRTADFCRAKAFQCSLRTRANRCHRACHLRFWFSADRGVSRGFSAPCGTNAGRDWSDGRLTCCQLDSRKPRGNFRDGRNCLLRCGPVKSVITLGRTGTSRWSGFCLIPTCRSGSWRRTTCRLRRPRRHASWIDMPGAGACLSRTCL